ncbi:amidohydrolase family protein [Litorisediminicola beolgyonensis]|uniref:Amidohydrolase family protein n=1 Tax=Litorisediminicola beolgyonensis TaxID=1173614 RepID=A0ABW3ZDI0_9RHOB
MIQFDCHAHVYETVRAVAVARYTPACPAPLSDWLGHQADHGLKGGVIVQVSFLGTDNSEMCRALAELDRNRFAGVGVVPLDVSDADLDRLVAAGMRGVRWNLVAGAPRPDLRSPLVARFIEKLGARDLHLEVHLEGDALAPILPDLTDLGVNLVVDHFGLPSAPTPADDPFLTAVSRLEDRSALFLKFSAPYRMPFDVRPHADTLLSLLSPGHVLWGSDWPHTRHETRTSYAENHRWAEMLGALSDQAAAKRLYGIALDTGAEV